MFEPRPTLENERKKVPRELALLRSNILAEFWDKPFSALLDADGQPLPGVAFIPENKGLFLGEFLFGSHISFDSFRRKVHNKQYSQLKPVIERYYQVFPRPITFLENNPHLINWVPWDVFLAYGDAVTSEPTADKSARNPIDQVSSGHLYIADARQRLPRGYLDKKEHLFVHHQNANPRYQSVKEAIANAIDAIKQGEKIGQFGMGIKQLFSWNGRVTISTHQKGRAIFSLTTQTGYDDKTYLKFGQPTPSKENNSGTTIAINRITLDPEEIEALQQEIAETYAFVKEVDIYCNGKLINPFLTTYSLRQPTDALPKGRVDITLSKRSITVTDNGVGMDRKKLFNMFLPSAGSKGMNTLSQQDMQEHIEQHTEVGFRQSTSPKLYLTRNQETLIALPISPDTARLNDTDVYIELGKALKTSIGREGVILDQDCVQALKVALEQIMTQGLLSTEDRWGMVCAVLSGIEQLSTDLDSTVQSQQQNIYEAMIESASHTLRPFLEQMLKDGYRVYPNSTKFNRIDAAKKIFLPLSLYKKLDGTIHFMEKNEHRMLTPIEGIVTKNGWRVYVADLHSAELSAVSPFPQGTDLTHLKLNLETTLPLLIDQDTKTIILDRKRWHALEYAQDDTLQNFLRESLQSMINEYVFTSYEPEDLRTVFVTERKAPPLQGEHNTSMQYHERIVWEQIVEKNKKSFCWINGDRLYRINQHDVLEIFDYTTKKIVHTVRLENLFHTLPDQIVIAPDNTTWLQIDRTQFVHINAEGKVIDETNILSLPQLHPNGIPFSSQLSQIQLNRKGVVTLNLVDGFQSQGDLRWMKKRVCQYDLVTQEFKDLENIGNTEILHFGDADFVSSSGDRYSLEDNYPQPYTLHIQKIGGKKQQIEFPPSFKQGYTKNAHFVEFAEGVGFICTVDGVMTFNFINIAATGKATLVPIFSGKPGEKFSVVANTKQPGMLINTSDKVIEFPYLNTHSQKETQIRYGTALETLEKFSREQPEIITKLPKNTPLLISPVSLTEWNFRFNITDDAVAMVMNELKALFDEDGDGPSFLSYAYYFLLASECDTTTGKYNYKDSILQLGPPEPQHFPALGSGRRSPAPPGIHTVDNHHQEKEWNNMWAPHARSNEKEFRLHLMKNELRELENLTLPAQDDRILLDAQDSFMTKGAGSYSDSFGPFQEKFTDESAYIYLPRENTIPLTPTEQKAVQLCDFLRSKQFRDIFQSIWGSILDLDNQEITEFKKRFLKNLTYLTRYNEQTITQQLVWLLMISEKPEVFLDQNPEDLTEFLSFYTTLDTRNEARPIISILEGLAVHTPERSLSLLVQQMQKLRLAPALFSSFLHLVTQYAASLNELIRQKNTLPLSHPLRAYLLFLSNNVDFLRTEENTLPQAERLTPVLPDNTPLSLLMYLVRVEGLTTFDEVQEYITQKGGVDQLMSSLNLERWRQEQMQVVFAQGVKPGASKREMVQNGIHAILQSPKEHGILAYDTYVQDDGETYVQEFVDNGTGIINMLTLLVPGLSGKNGEEGFGMFGSGLYLALAEGKIEIRSISETPEGQKVLKVTVLSQRTRDDGSFEEIIVDTCREQTLDEFDAPTGTSAKILSTNSVELPELKAMLDKFDVLNMAGLACTPGILAKHIELTTRNSEGDWESLSVNGEIVDRFELENGEFITLVSSDLSSQVTSQGLQMTELQTPLVDYLSLVPKVYRNILIEKKISVIAPKSWKLIKDRSRFAQEDQRVALIRQALASLAPRLFAQELLKSNTLQTASARAFSRELPTDLFTSEKVVRQLLDLNIEYYISLGRSFDPGKFASELVLSQINGFPHDKLQLFFICFEVETVHGKYDSLLRRLQSVQNENPGVNKHIQALNTIIQADQRPTDNTNFEHQDFYLTKARSDTVSQKQITTFIQALKDNDLPPNTHRLADVPLTEGVKQIIGKYFALFDFANVVFTHPDQILSGGFFNRNEKLMALTTSAKGRIERNDIDTIVHETAHLFEARERQLTEGSLGATKGLSADELRFTHQPTGDFGRFYRLAAWILFEIAAEQLALQ